jgi:hypothetical protein
MVEESTARAQRNAKDAAMKAVTLYESFDGQRHPSERDCVRHEARLRGLLYECPKCNGTGHDQGKPIYTPFRHVGPVSNSVDGWGVHQCVVHENRLTGYAHCDMCNGAGYTSHPKKPVTRTEVVGYE